MRWSPSRNDDRAERGAEALRPAPRAGLRRGARRARRGGLPAPGRLRRLASARLAERVRALSPRQVLLPTAATAFVAVLLATALVATNRGGGASVDSSAARVTRHGQPEFAEQRATSIRESAAASPPRGSSAGAEPKVRRFEGSGPKSGRTERAHGLPDGRAAGAAHRDVERSAQIVLGAEPEAGLRRRLPGLRSGPRRPGVVLGSTIAQRPAGDAGARFDLLIPSARLDDALGSFSGIAEVLSRNDGTADITAPTVGATERLRGLPGADRLAAERAGRRRKPKSSAKRSKGSCAPSAAARPSSAPR